MLSSHYSKVNHLFALLLSSPNCTKKPSQLHCIRPAIDRGLPTPAGALQFHGLDRASDGRQRGQDLGKISK